MSDDLVEFLEARLAEREALARRGAEIFFCGWPDYQTFDSPELDDAYKYLDMFGPARMLREVEAGRAEIALYRDLAAEYERTRHGADMMRRDALRTVLGHRAAVWSDHPDYRPEWAS